MRAHSRRRSRLLQIVVLSLIVAVPAWHRRLHAQQPKPASLAIIALHPDGTTAGKVFNSQPDGASAIAVTCKGATNTTSIVFAGEKLPTVYGGSTLLTAKVPSRLYSKSGRYDVYLVNKAGEKSNIVKFAVQ